MLRFVESLLIIIVNGLVLLSFKRFPHIRCSTTCLICGLSSADLLGSFLSLLMVLVSLCRGTITWVYIAHVKLLAMLCFTLGNLVYSALIALERLITLTYPLRYMTFITTERTAVVTIGIGVYLVILSIALTLYNHSNLTKIPQIPYHETIISEPTTYIIASAHFYLFITIIILCYIMIGRLAYQKRVGDRRRLISKSQWKITKMMATVLLIF